MARDGATNHRLLTQYAQGAAAACLWGAIIFSTWTVPSPRAASIDDPFVTMPKPDQGVTLLGVAGSPGIVTPDLVPEDAVAADFNCDGYTDLAVAYAFSETLICFFGSEEQTFVPARRKDVGFNAGALDDLPRTLLAEDFDQDGFVDLALLNSGNPDINRPVPAGPSLGILYGAPNGDFEPFEPIPLSPSEGFSPLFSIMMEAGRFGEDDAPHLIVAHPDARVFSLIRHIHGRLWGQADLFEVETEGFGPVAFKAVDLDFDGLGDLIVLNRNDIQVWKGDAEGGFAQRRRIADPAEVAARNFTAIELADFNQDGRWDLVALEGGTNRMRLFMGLEVSGEFQDVINISLTRASGAGDANLTNGPIDLVVYDANADGFDDVAVIFLLSGGGAIYFGQADPANAPLVFRRAFDTAVRPRALLKADINNDRRPDLVIVNEGDQLIADNQDLVFDFNEFDRPPADQSIGDAPTSPGISFPPSLDRPRGLAWDRTRGTVWTIDRKQRLFAQMTGEGDIIRESVIPMDLPRLVDGSLQQVFQDPSDLAVDREGNLWIVDRLAASLVTMTAQGHVIEVISTLEALEMPRPTGVAYDPLHHRLFICDPTETLLVEIPLSGGPPIFRRLRAMQDLAYDERRGSLWGVPADEPFFLLQIRLENNTSPDVGVTLGPALPLGELAPILRQVLALSVAYDAEHGRFFVLTDQGALVLFEEESESTSIRELRLLREIRAVANSFEDTLLLADSGLLGTIARINLHGDVLDHFQINPLDVWPPIDIRGLSSNRGIIYVLDGGQGRVANVGSVFRFGPRGDRLGRIATGLPLGRRVRGLHFDPVGRRLFIGTLGRLIEQPFIEPITIEPVPTEPIDANEMDERPIVSHHITTVHSPSSISAGPEGFAVTMFAPEQGFLIFFNPDADATVDRRTKLARIGPLPLKFRPLAAVPATHSNNAWHLVGAGESSVLLATETPTPSNAADSAWLHYE